MSGCLEVNPTYTQNPLFIYPNPSSRIDSLSAKGFNISGVEAGKPWKLTHWVEPRHAAESAPRNARDGAQRRYSFMRSTEFIWDFAGGGFVDVMFAERRRDRKSPREDLGEEIQDNPGSQEDVGYHRLPRGGNDPESLESRQKRKERGRQPWRGAAGLWGSHSACNPEQRGNEATKVSDGGKNAKRGEWDAPLAGRGFEPLDACGVGVGAVMGQSWGDLVRRERVDGGETHSVPHDTAGHAGLLAVPAGMALTAACIRRTWSMRGSNIVAGRTIYAGNEGVNVERTEERLIVDRKRRHGPDNAMLSEPGASGRDGPEGGTRGGDYSRGPERRTRGEGARARARAS
ncbi:hypothetical protein C8R44DRAFT_945000 [Mycena epipterygia]|nr:hypothetical protein C8R44DRAFT_945000 [Mycena epipterygia]